MNNATSNTPGTITCPDAMEISILINAIADKRAMTAETKIRPAPERPATGSARRAAPTCGAVWRDPWLGLVPVRLYCGGAGAARSV